jgi:hypothetical protein
VMDASRSWLATKYHSTHDPIAQSGRSLTS